MVCMQCQLLALICSLKRAHHLSALHDPSHQTQAMGHRNQGPFGSQISRVHLHLSHQRDDVSFLTALSPPDLLSCMSSASLCSLPAPPTRIQKSHFNFPKSTRNTSTRNHVHTDIQVSGRPGNSQQASRIRWLCSRTVCNSSMRPQSTPESAASFSPTY